MRRAVLAALAAAVLGLSGCSGPSEPELWIYTSVYQEVLDQMAPKVERAMTGVRLRWYKAGSEEVAARLTAELAAGSSPADVLMTADPFWYQSLADEGLLARYVPPEASRIPPGLSEPNGAYLASRAAAMVIACNTKVLPSEQMPRSFAALAEPRFKGKVVIGDPLKSGTSLATVAALSRKLGWSYYSALRANDVVVEGGNSAVLRRVETGDRPVGVVLLENLIEARKYHSPAEIVYPADGPIVIPSPIAILASSRQPEAAQRFVRYILGREGQQSMVEGRMYAIDPALSAPPGARPFAELVRTGLCLDARFVREATPEREAVKETFGQIMFE